MYHQCHGSAWIITAPVHVLTKHDGDFQIWLGRNQEFRPLMTVGIANVCFEREYDIPNFGHYVA